MLTSQQQQQQQQRHVNSIGSSPSPSFPYEAICWRIRALWPAVSQSGLSWFHILNLVLCSLYFLNILLEIGFRVWFRFKAQFLWQRL